MFVLFVLVKQVNFGFRVKRYLPGAPRCMLHEVCAVQYLYFATSEASKASKLRMYLEPRCLLHEVGRCVLVGGGSERLTRCCARCLCVIRQHTSAYGSIRQHTSAYDSTRQHTSAYVSIRQHTSAYVSIRQHTSAYITRARCELYMLTNNARVLLREVFVCQSR